MAAIERLSIVNATGATDTTAFTSTGAYFASVVVTNKSTSANDVFSVWIAPEGDDSAGERGYIAANVPLAVNQTFETIRFALNVTDVLKVRAGTSNLSFIVQGIDQPNA